MPQIWSIFNDESWREKIPLNEKDPVTPAARAIFEASLLFLREGKRGLVIKHMGLVGTLVPEPLAHLCRRFHAQGKGRIEFFQSQRPDCPYRYHFRDIDTEGHVIVDLGPTDTECYELAARAEQDEKVMARRKRVRMGESTPDDDRYHRELTDSEYEPSNIFVVTLEGCAYCDIKDEEWLES